MKIKIAICNDTHFGYKNSASLFQTDQEKFFHEVFFPYCEEHGITDVLHLGDFFDNRKHITLKTLRFVREKILNEFEKRGMHVHAIPGNHCCAYKNTNELNSMTEVLKQYDCCSIYMDPITLTFDDLNIGLVPWISHENREQCMDFIKTAPAQIIMGHFQIGGFSYMANSNIKSEGMGVKPFERYDMVLSGHYHTKSAHHNITYLGSQYQFTWADVDDKKYFHVLDTETRELEPVANPNTVYVRYYYDEDDIDDIQKYINKRKFAKKNISGKYVRIIIKKKTNLYTFDAFLQHIKDCEPYDLTTIENFEESNPETNEVNETIEDTSTLLDNYIDNALNTHLDKNKLKKKFRDLYHEASIEGTI